MKFNTKIILEILGENVIYSRVKDFDDYSCIDIVHVDGINTHPGKKLIFATYGVENEWHFAFDRRVKVELYSKENHVLVDFTTDIENTIQVKSLDVAAKLLYDYVYSLHHNHTTVIGVTGSVGKTTTVGMMEHTLKDLGKNVVRFYSKRIFPLSLFCHYINKVSDETEYIVLEYSLFYSSHVEILAKLLPPTYAFILNILNMHMEERLGFYSKEDIFNAKIKIYVPGITRKVFLHDDLVGYKITSKIDIEYYPSIKLNHVRSMPPTIRTLQMLGALEKFSEQICANKMLPNFLVSSLRDYVPVEQRIILLEFDEKMIYFHGETSTAERLKSFLESDLTCNLFVDEINFSQGDPNYYIEELKYIFERPTTFVLDTAQNRDRLTMFNINPIFIPKTDFIKKMQKISGYIVYHKALFVRQKDTSVLDYIQNLYSQ